MKSAMSFIACGKEARACWGEESNRAAGKGAGLNQLEKIVCT